jgi:tRNA threonylcarbamoyladenosine biosynthesis protein TsaE
VTAVGGVGGAGGAAGPGAAPSAAAPRLSASADETARLGAALGAALAAGDVVALCGPLGAGKTRFVDGIVRGLGLSSRVTSPSFTLVHEYPGALTVFHLDLYRLEPEDVEGLGLDELLERGALIVEWGEKLPAARRAAALTVAFEIVSPEERALAASATEGRGLELLAGWRAIGAAR